MENCPHYYPELSGVSLDDAKKKAESLSEKSKEKQLPGGKTKKVKEPEVTIRKLTRSGKKCVTSVEGLEGFDVKLEAVAKLFKKKFSCGCSVVKGTEGKADSVDIQGDFEVEVIDALCGEFKNISRDKICVGDSTTK